MIKFSVLMSVYNKESADFFNQAMISVVDEKSLRPDEIILVKDGL
jgi:collagenase-like PrtC family protease